MNKQQLKPHAHFSRLLAIFHERELIVLGLMINLSIIALFGLASNSFHLQTYAQLFEGREFEVPEQPEGCNGRCVYSYNSGGYYKKEEQSGGGIGFTPCQSASYCGGSGSSTNEQALCGTAAGCSYTGPNGNTIFCAGNKCTECTSGGRCTELDPKRYPSSIQKPPASGWSGSNYNGTCSGPGCAPGTVPPSTNVTCSPNCPASFANTNNGYGGGTTIIGDQVIKFDAGSTTSTDGKYTRTCSAGGSCTVTPVTQAGGSGSSGSAGQTPQFLWNVVIDPVTGLYHIPTVSGYSHCGSAPRCDFSLIYKGIGYSFSCAAVAGGGQGCSVVPQRVGDPDFITHIRNTNPQDLTDNIINFGTEETPFYIDYNGLTSRTINPCLATSGECHVQTNRGAFICTNGSCSPASSSSQEGGETGNSGGQAGGANQEVVQGSGTAADPYVVDELIVDSSRRQDNPCIGTTSGCYVRSNAGLFVCRNGGICEAVTAGANPVDQKGYLQPGMGKGSSQIYYFPGMPEPREFGVLSSDGTISQITSICGDLICSGNETSASCPQDCGGSSVTCTVGASRRLVCE